MAEARRRRRQAQANANQRNAASGTSANAENSESPKKPVSQVLAEEQQMAALYTFGGFILAFFFISLSFRTAVPLEGVQHAVMIDGGSTGTRAQVFTFRHTSDNFSLVSTKMFKTDKRLALLSLGDQPGSQFFKSLLDDVRKAIPGPRRRLQVPIALRATGGLRLLTEEGANEALDQARAALRQSGFLFKDDWVSILDDTAEGVGAWTTANFLLGRIQSHSENKNNAGTVGIFDLGGASLQIAFEGNDDAISEIAKAAREEVNDGSNQLLSPPTVTDMKLETDSPTRHIVSKSYLGLGLMDFKKKLYHLFDSEGVLEEGNPCFRLGKKFVNKTIEVGLDGSSEKRNVTLTGDGDFERCVASAEIVMVTFAPLDSSFLKHVKSTEFYAFAYLYDRTVGLGLPEVPTQKMLEAKGKLLCETRPPKTVTKDFDEACAEFSYVYALLKKLTNNFSASGPKFRLVQYVDGHMLGWALGNVLHDFKEELAAQVAGAE